MNIFIKAGLENFLATLLLLFKKKPRIRLVFIENKLLSEIQDQNEKILEILRKNKISIEVDKCDLVDVADKNTINLREVFVFIPKNDNEVQYCLSRNVPVLITDRYGLKIYGLPCGPLFLNY